MAKALQITFLAVFLALGSAAYAQKSPVGGNISNVNPCQLFVPNAFTPNGDNINDQFLIKYNGECKMVGFQIHIFDRWGRIVYENRDPDPAYAWDGTSDGLELKEGVYMWKISCSLIDPAKPNEALNIHEQGSVVLIR